jgi:hypothetical protein
MKSFAVLLFFFEVIDARVFLLSVNIKEEEERSSVINGERCRVKE